MRANAVVAFAVAGAFVALCGAMPIAAWGQKLYKHVDEKGLVTYTDIPLAPEEKRLEVSNTKRNGDGDSSRSVNGKKTGASTEEKPQSKGKGGPRAHKQRPSAGTGKASQD